MLLNLLATVPADITAILTDAGDLWDDVKIFVVGVATFYVLFRIVKRVKGK